MSVVANEILRQLGGRHFMVTTGAKDLIASETMLAFKLPSKLCINKITHCKIVLDASDTYTVIFMNIRGINIKEISKHEGVFNDMLVKLFETETGLFTRLF